MSGVVTSSNVCGRGPESCGGSLIALQRTLWDELRLPYYHMVSGISEQRRVDKWLYGFAPLVGSGYLESRSRLLVVGRAVDGWRNGWDLATTVEEVVGKVFGAPVEDKEAGCLMNWISRNMAKNKKDSGRYNFRRSSFWSASRDVLAALEGRALAENEWPGLMAWSNVYKISPQRGNPGHTLRSAQIDSCIEILRTEIEILKPRHVLFVTGGWGKRILESVGVHLSPPGPVRFSGKLAAAEGHPLAVVADRPEGKKRKAWVDAVVEGFGSAGAGI